jgi:hypothetical protein
VTLRPNVWYEGPVALLDELYVVPELRGRGVGSTLLMAAEAMTRERGGELLEINVGGDDIDARRFYEQHGYTNTEPAASLLLPGTDGRPDLALPAGHQSALRSDLSVSTEIGQGAYLALPDRGGDAAPRVPGQLRHAGCDMWSDHGELGDAPAGAARHEPPLVVVLR